MKDANDTVIFLDVIVRFWKLVNVSGQYGDDHFHDQLKCQVCADESTSLNDLVYLVPVML